MVGIAVEAALFLGFSLHSVIVSSHEVPPAGPVELNELAEGLRRRTKSEEENSSGNLAPYQHP